MGIEIETEIEHARPTTKVDGDRAGRGGARLGLEVIVELLEMRFEYNELGRIVGRASGTTEGGTPRFVLGRSPQGCVWRFSVGLDPAVLVQVAKLAGREPAFPVDARERLLPPERWVMIERLFGVSDPSARGEPSAAEPARRARGDERAHPYVRTHENVEHAGEIVGDLWVID